MSTGSTGGYPVPDERFNAIEHARNKILRANQTQTGIIQQWITAYEDFYGLLPDGGSQYTSEQMQQILAAMPFTVCRDIMTDSAAFVAFVDSAKPGALENKYKTPAFEMLDDGSMITVGDLRPAWQGATADGNAVG